MKTLIAFFAGLFMLCMAGSASAHGHSFVQGMADNHELASLVRKSLAADPKGNTSVTPAHCTKTNLLSCANPRDLYDAFRLEDTDSGLTDISQLADYIDSLEEVTVPDATEAYISACLLINDQGVHQVLADCDQREFRTGEKAYANPRTHKIVLMGNCNNPTSGPTITVTVTLDCPKVVFGGPSGYKGDGWVVFVYGPQHDRLPAQCTSLKRAGDTSYHPRLPDDCPDVCGGWEGIEVIRSKFLHDATAEPEQGFKLSFVQDVDGINTLRLPSVVLDGHHEVFICRIGADGKTQYMRVGVRNHPDDPSKNDFIDGVATLYDQYWQVSPVPAPKELTPYEQNARDQAEAYNRAHPAPPPDNDQ